MKLKIGIGIAAALVATAVMASSASAAVSTTRAEWYTGASPGTTLPVGADETLNLELVTHTDLKSHAVFKSAIGVGGTTPLQLTASGVSCISCKITTKK